VDNWVIFYDGVETKYVFGPFGCKEDIEKYLKKNKFKKSNTQKDLWFKDEERAWVMPIRTP
jgi:hypothetical protein